MLAVYCLVHFVAAHPGAYLTCLEEVEDLSSGAEHYYPLATMAVALVGAMCDELGLSRRMRGPLNPRDLRKYLHSSKGPGVVGQWVVTAGDGAVAAFAELFGI